MFVAVFLVRRNCPAVIVIVIVSMTSKISFYLCELLIVMTVVVIVTVSLSHINIVTVY